LLEVLPVMITNASFSMRQNSYFQAFVRHPTAYTGFYPQSCNMPDAPVRDNPAKSGVPIPASYKLPCP